ncbi:hypothetical protein SAMN05428966_102358 [Massilia sp. PDC64]|nr:hypothetical protein [Massilia sp. PDC64]SDC79749.1 hypothetical protein SAMN05428966_102358 [Massilia sp. PDC64]
MDELFENGLGLAAALFVAACVLGVLWGKDGQGQPIKAVGDRVACGLFAMPLVSMAVHENFPDISNWWSVAAPIPLGIYVVLLACTDGDCKPKYKAHFSMYLLRGTLAVYAVMAACFLLTA